MGVPGPPAPDTGYWVPAAVSTKARNGQGWGPPACEMRCARHMDRSGQRKDERMVPVTCEGAADQPLVDGQGTQPTNHPRARPRRLPEGVAHGAIDHCHRMQAAIVQRREGRVACCCSVPIEADALPRREGGWRRERVMRTWDRVALSFVASSCWRGKAREAALFRPCSRSRASALLIAAQVT